MKTGSVVGNLDVTKVVFGAAGFVAIAASLAFGQANTLQSAIATQAQVVAHPPAFEIASVRQTPPSEIGYTSISPAGSSKFTATNATLKVLLETAFNVDDTDIVKGPSWLDSQHYNIAAKSEGDVSLSYEQLEPLLQQLLQQRFHLVCHRETKSFSGYALVTVEGKAKLHPTENASPHAYILADGLEGHVSLEMLAVMLRRPVGKPVVDETGLKGEFDINLKYAPEGSIDSPLPSVFTALREDLGLRLKPQNVPLQVLVIDHVDRVPTEN